MLDGLLSEIWDGWGLPVMIVLFVWVGIKTYINGKSGGSGGSGCGGCGGD